MVVCRFEAGFASTSLLFKCDLNRIKFNRISEVHFWLPVSVGDLLEIVARPVFTEGSTVIVNVSCRVKDPLSAEFSETNQLHIEFERIDGSAAQEVPQIVRHIAYSAVLPVINAHCCAKASKSLAPPMLLLSFPSSRVLLCGHPAG